VQTSEDRIVIRSSRTKLILVVVGALLFVVLGVLLITMADDQNRHSPIYVKTVSVVCIAFFGLCAVVGLVKLFDGAPGLVLDRQGIIDNSSALGAGRVDWREIQDVRAVTISGQKFLAFYVEDPGRFLNKGNVVMRLFLKMNYRMYGSPIFISSHSLKVNFEELEILVHDFRGRHGHIKES